MMMPSNDQIVEIFRCIFFLNYTQFKLMYNSEKNINHHANPMINDATYLKLVKP